MKLRSHKSGHRFAKVGVAVMAGASTLTLGGDTPRETCRTEIVTPDSGLEGVFQGGCSEGELRRFVRAYRQAPPPFGREPRIVSYNILSGKNVEGRSNADQVVAYLRAENADVVLLQEVKEVFGASYVRKIAKQLDMNLLRIPGGELAILSRYPIVGAAAQRFPKASQNPDSPFTRGMLVGELEVNGERLLVATTHLDNPLRDKAKTQPNALQLGYGADFLEAAARAGVPSVLGGDFNVNFSVGTLEGELTEDEWLSKYRPGEGRHALGTISNPLAMENVNRIAAVSKDQLESELYTVILTDGREVTPAEAAALAPFEKDNKKREELWNAADGSTHPGADKSFDRIFVVNLETGRCRSYMTPATDHALVSCTVKEKAS